MNIQSSKTQIIIVSVLAFIFIAVLGGALWDLYLRDIIAKKTTTIATTQTPTITGVPVVTQPATLPTGVGNMNKGEKPATPKTTGTNKPGKPVNEDVSYATYSKCLENTKTLGASKDCCDCLTADEPVRKACRDAAATYDFSKNTVFSTFEIPSVLGRSGDYSACTASGDQQQCKQCCESTGKFVCGDYQYCRTACNNIAK